MIPYTALDALKAMGRADVTLAIPEPRQAARDRRRFRLRLPRHPRAN